MNKDPKALKEYNKLLKLDPRDAKLRLEIGDTYRRWGQIAEAIETSCSVERPPKRTATRSFSTLQG